MANRPATDLLGHDEAVLVGQPIEVVFPALSASELPAADPLTEPARRFDLRLKTTACRADGTAVPVELTLTLVEADGRPVMVGRVTAVGAEAPDTARVPAPAPAGHLTLLKDEFLAMLAHELRTPLQSILGWTQLLRQAPRDAEMTSHALEVIERNIHRQAQVIDDLIDLAEILSGRLRLEFRQVQVAPLIESVYARTSEAAQAANIRLDRSVDSDAEFRADPERIEHVLMTLVANGIRFSSEGGRVEIRSRIVGSEVQITVSDTGQGIDPVRLPRILDSARGADEGSRHERSGLGLPIVRGLVEMQGGTIYAESAGVGHGSSFTVSFPLAN